MIVRDLLDPVFKMEEPIRLVCCENKKEALLAKLALHELDIVLSDSPIGNGLNIKAFNHSLGECGLTFFAVNEISKPLQQDFPDSLDGAPMLLPCLRPSARKVMVSLWHQP